MPRNFCHVISAIFGFIEKPYFAVRWRKMSCLPTHAHISDWIEFASRGGRGNPQSNTKRVRVKRCFFVTIFVDTEKIINLLECHESLVKVDGWRRTGLFGELWYDDKSETACTSVLHYWVDSPRIFFYYHLLCLPKHA